MFITSYNKTSFNANINSAKLRFNRNDFFIRIQGYGRNESWADDVIKTTDAAAEGIVKKTPAEKVLQFITAGIRSANAKLGNTRKSKHTGLLRTVRNGWQSEPDCAYTFYARGRYSSYANRLNMLCIYPLEETPDKLAISRPINFSDIEHGEQSKINNSLEVVFNDFQKLFPKYLNQDAKKKDLPDINSTIAEIRWILAHATPWVRGSDAISNAFMRAIYKAAGVKTFPVKEGISLDLEAYCTTLSDYKKCFPKYFEKPPEIVD